MKTTWNFLIGIILGAVIGWILGFLRLPYIEKNASFWVGFAACMAFILSVVVFLFVWDRHSLLLRLIGKNPSTQDSQKITRAYSLIWTMVFVFIVIGATINSVLIYKQNDWLSMQAKRQNKRILEMTEVAESSRKSNLAFLMSSVLEDVRNEVKNHPNRVLSDSTIAKLAVLTNSIFMPYRYFEGDSLSDKALSPERGQLLLALLSMNMDSNSFVKMKLGISFSAADMRRADLRGADFSNMDLKGADLKNANLSGANLRGTDLRDADLNGADLRGANLNKADLRRADLGWAILNGAVLTSANLNGAILMHAQLRKADLRNAAIQWAQADGVMLLEANLSRADLTGTGLRKANLNEANLTEADLRRTNLSEASLLGAELNRAIADEKWLNQIDTWRLAGAKEVQKSYRLVNDSTDKWKKPLYRLKKNVENQAR